jgi:hypothetical protein
MTGILAARMQNRGGVLSELLVENVEPGQVRRIQSTRHHRFHCRLALYWPRARHPRERVGELPPGVGYMPKPWQPLNVLIADEQALASRV